MPDLEIAVSWHRVRGRCWWPKIGSLQLRGALSTDLNTAAIGDGVQTLSDGLIFIGPEVCRFGCTVILLLDLLVATFALAFAALMALHCGCNG